MERKKKIRRRYSKLKPKQGLIIPHRGKPYFEDADKHDRFVEFAFSLTGVRQRPSRNQHTAVDEQLNVIGPS